MSALSPVMLERSGAPTGSRPAEVAAFGRTASAPTAASHGLQLDLVTDLAGLDGLQTDWRALSARAGTARQVFQTFDFASLWARSFLGSDGTCRRHPKATRCTCKLAVVTGRRNGRLVLVWPLVLQHRFGFKILSALGEPVAQYSDWLAEPDELGPETLDQALALLKQRLVPDVVRLRRVRADAQIEPLLAARDAQKRETAEAPFVALTPDADGTGFDARQSSKSRKNRRRLARRLEERGTVAFTVLSGTQEAVAVADDCIAMKRHWLRHRGLISPALATSRFDRFIADACGDAAGTTGSTVFALQLDGSPVAGAIGFIAGGHLMLHLITYAEAVEKCGAGVLLLEAILTWAEKQGLETVDLLPPSADYKLQWASGCVSVADRTMGLTPAGRAYLALHDDIARPLSKRIVAALPMALKRRLASRLLSEAETD